MKHFLFFIGKIILLLLLSASVLDLSYTYIYSKSTTRNKVANVLNSTSKSYDVIMLGSSRANNHFDTQLFVDKGLKSFNYGISGSRLQESALLLQLMLVNDYDLKTVILEIDLNINSEGYSEGTRALFMPCLRSNKIVSNYYEDIIPEFNLLYYVPFYRYINYDSQIGFRELFFSAINKPSASIQNLGFSGLKGSGTNMKYDLSKYSVKKNKDYEFIKDICKAHKINLLVLSTPMCSQVKGIEYFDAINTIYPEVHNYENSVTGDQYFSSCGHMNTKGAALFTQQIINDFF
ncbi:hypothetical protein FLGE108171_08070 [Flavobacterium gelidilacus]|uniref:hypothetical protein n=1 Tax=Flavobacterium gelidilacus TaxID=206041 RepID=UPI0003FA4103|nr:hypothetical protein [Flavobacterium gelidilacus]